MPEPQAVGRATRLDSHAFSSIGFNFYFFAKFRESIGIFLILYETEVLIIINKNN